MFMVIFKLITMLSEFQDFTSEDNNLVNFFFRYALMCILNYIYIKVIILYISSINLFDSYPMQVRWSTIIHITIHTQIMNFHFEIVFFILVTDNNIFFNEHIIMVVIREDESSKTSSFGIIWENWREEDYILPLQPTKITYSMKKPDWKLH